MKSANVFRLFLTVLLIAAFGGTHAAEVRVAPEPYFRHAEFTQMRLSPSGQTIVAVAAVNGRRGLVLIDLETRKPRVVAALADSDVRDFAWVNDKRLVFDVIDMEVGSGEQRGGGMFAIDVDGSNFRTLAPPLQSLIRSGQFVYRYTRLARTLSDGSDDVLALSNDRNRDYPDVVRLNTRDGRKTLLTDDWPGNPVAWVADRDGNVRAAVTTEKGIKSQSWWRESKDAKWRLIGSYGLRDARVVPVAFDADGSLIVASDIGRKTEALYRFDGSRNAPGEMLAEHGSVDLERVATDRRDGKIVGVAYTGAKEGVAWFDDEWARISSLVDRALPNHYNSFSRGAANRMLISSRSDTDPGSWYLLDLDSRKLEYLASARKDIVAADMPKREAVSYKARDGLTIPAILTLPKGREAKNLPLVLYVHGGPYVRNWHVSWDGEAAYLAALGYAVLEPEFRGSRGFGRAHFQAGWKQWGLAMQDDLVDGIDWLASRGTIDPKRVCIMGASYGGYAVMMGLARDPDRYRCGINYVGVTDISLMFTVTWSDLSNSDFIRYGAKELIGDPDKDAALFKANSPLENAKKIRAPVLMAYGVEDRRVPLVHGERMRDALRANGTPVEWVTYSEEGHGFLLEKNRFDFYNRVAAFLAQHLPVQ